MFISQLPVPGIEPVSPASEADVVTTTPPALSRSDLIIFFGAEIGEEIVMCSHLSHRNSTLRKYTIVTIIIIKI